MLEQSKQIQFKDTNEAEKLLSIYLLNNYKQDRFAFESVRCQAYLAEFKLSFLNFFLPLDGEFHVSFIVFHEILFQALALYFNLNVNINCFDQIKILNVDCKLAKKIVKTEGLRLTLHLEPNLQKTGVNNYLVRFDMEENSFCGSLLLEVPFDLQASEEFQLSSNCSQYIPNYLKTIKDQMDYELTCIQLSKLEASCRVQKQFLFQDLHCQLYQRQLLDLIVTSQLAIAFGSIVCGFNEKPSEFYLTRLRWAFDQTKFQKDLFDEFYYMHLEKKLFRYGKNYLAINFSSQSQSFSGVSNFIF